MAKAMAHITCHDCAVPEYAVSENGYVFFRTTSFDRALGRTRTTKWTPMPQASYYMNGTSIVMKALVSQKAPTEYINGRVYLVTYENLKLKLPNLP